MTYSTALLWLKSTCFRLSRVTQFHSVPLPFTKKPWASANIMELKHLLLRHLRFLIIYAWKQHHLSSPAISNYLTSLHVQNRTFPGVGRQQKNECLMMDASVKGKTSSSLHHLSIQHFLLFLNDYLTVFS